MNGCSQSKTGGEVGARLFLGLVLHDAVHSNRGDVTVIYDAAAVLLDHWPTIRCYARDQSRI